MRSKYLLIVHKTYGSKRWTARGRGGGVLVFVVDAKKKTDHLHLSDTEPGSKTTLYIDIGENAILNYTLVQ